MSQEEEFLNKLATDLGSFVLGRQTMVLLKPMPARLARPRTSKPGQAWA